MTTSHDTKYLTWSIGGHLALLVFMTVKILVFPAERPSFIRSVRVDLVGLPEKNPVEAPKAKEEASPKEEAPIKEEPKPAPPEKKAEPPKKEPKKEPSKKPEPSIKDSQSNALKRLQALSKIKKLKAQKNADAESAVYKGNIVSEGTSLTGVEKLQHDQYLEKLDQHIKQYWSLPAFLENEKLSAILQIRFNESGQVISKMLLRSSGNKVYDQQVLEAVENASPLPIPPESLASYLKVRGIELRFPE